MNNEVQVNSRPLEERTRTVVDLFSGCGGLSLGFELANFQICVALVPLRRKIGRFLDA